MRQKVLWTLFSVCTLVLGLKMAVASETVDYEQFPSITAPKSVTPKPCYEVHRQVEPTLGARIRNLPWITILTGASIIGNAICELYLDTTPVGTGLPIARYVVENRPRLPALMLFVTPFFDALLGRLWRYPAASEPCTFTIKEIVDRQEPIIREIKGTREELAKVEKAENARLSTDLKGRFLDKAETSNEHKDYRVQVTTPQPWEPSRFPWATFLTGGVMAGRQLCMAFLFTNPVGPMAPFLVSVINFLPALPTVAFDIAVVFDVLRSYYVPTVQRQEIRVIR